MVVRRSKRNEKSYVKIVQVGGKRKLIVSEEELDESSLAMKNLKIGLKILPLYSLKANLLIIISIYNV